MLMTAKSIWIWLNHMKCEMTTYVLLICCSLSPGTSHSLEGIFSSHVSLSTEKIFLGQSNINHMLTPAKHVQNNACRKSLGVWKFKPYLFWRYELRSISDSVCKKKINLISFLKLVVLTFRTSQADYNDRRFRSNTSNQTVKVYPLDKDLAIYGLLFEYTEFVLDSQKTVLEMFSLRFTSVGLK